jgi:hypothetical protein
MNTIKEESRNIMFDRFYQPESYVDMRHVESKYVRQVFNERMCEKCDYRDDRSSSFYLCMECEGYISTYSFFNKVKIKGDTYIGLPRIEGEGKSFVDKRIKKFDLSPELQLTCELWPNQLKVISDILGEYTLVDGVYQPKVNTFYNGIIEAPPRTGKTLIVIALALSFGHKTLIIAHQTDLLNQFVLDIKERTNFDDIENSYGICKKVEDFYKYDVCLSTYQMFISKNGVKRLQEIKKLFGSIFIDEVHRSSALEYSKVLAAFPAANKIGVTGTVERKDNLHFVASTILGKVLTSVSSEVLTPTVYVHETKIGPSTEYKIWVYAMRFLQRHKKRNDLIVKYAMYDLKQGRSIVIPVTFVQMCKDLADQINLEYGEEIAVAFHGKSNREEILSKARSGKYRVVIGIRSIISTGVNVPLWDTLYEVAPISNAPVLLQETKRICTVYEGKNEPIIRHFVDSMAQSKWCFLACYLHTYVKLKYNISQETRRRSNAILKTLKKREMTHSETSLFSR